MKKLPGLIIALVLSNIGFGQDYQAEFKMYFQSNDTLNQEKVLNQWENENPGDPELFTSYFNYHISKSRKEIVTLSKEEPGGESLVIMDSLNQTAGFLGSQIYYDPVEFRNGIDRINKGIQLHPDRLDMRFGKVYAYGMREDWENFTKAIIETVEHSAQNKNEWLWTNNEKYGKGQEHFLGALQDYQMQLYQTGKDELLGNMREIALEVLKYYPDHVMSLSNLAITYLITGEFDKALEPLLKAEKLAPQDFIILSNIAHGYRMKGEKEKSIAYYERAIKFGDEQFKAFAKEQIEELKK